MAVTTAVTLMMLLYAIVSHMTYCAAAYRMVSASFVKCGTTPNEKINVVYVTSKSSTVFAHIVQLSGLWCASYIFCMHRKRNTKKNADT